MTKPKRKPRSNSNRLVKTTIPVAVFDIEELDKMITCLTMLIGKEKEDGLAKIAINANAIKMRDDLKIYRRNATEYFKLAE